MGSTTRAAPSLRVCSPLGWLLLPPQWLRPLGQVDGAKVSAPMVIVTGNIRGILDDQAVIGL